MRVLPAPSLEVAIESFLRNARNLAKIALGLDRVLVNAYFLPVNYISLER